MVPVCVKASCGDERELVGFVTSPVNEAVVSVEVEQVESEWEATCFSIDLTICGENVEGTRLFPSVRSASGRYITRIDTASRIFAFHVIKVDDSVASDVFVDFVSKLCRNSE
jgi:hypothetical protein